MSEINRMFVSQSCFESSCEKVRKFIEFFRRSETGLHAEVKDKKLICPKKVYFWAPGEPK
jgi:hypothetical protein